MSLFDVDLPAGRRWLRAGDAYGVTRKPRRGLDISASPSIPFAPMEAIPQGGAFAPDYMLRAPDEIRSGTYFERGDILVAKITPSFENGKQALTTALPSRFGFATTEVIPLRPVKEGHERRLLFYYLLHPDVRLYLADRMEGTTGRQRIPEDVLLDLPFPEFEPGEQTLIADSLETVQRLKAVETRSMRTAQALKRAAMKALFTRGLRGEAQKDTGIGRIPESWRETTLEELCDIVSGGTPRKSVEEYWGGNMPWVSGKDLKSPSLCDAIDHITEEGIQSGTRLVPKDSVLLLVRGMGLAKDLPVTTINRPMAFNQDIKGLIPHSDCSGHFLRSAIYASKERLLKQVVTSAHGTMTLSLTDVETFKIPYPLDPREADEIVQILHAIDRKFDLHRRKQAVLEELFTSLLHKLVTGEIPVGELKAVGMSGGADSIILTPKAIGEGA